MNDQIKEAAQFLRQQLESEGHPVGSSHSHQAVASYLGYNSKKALIDDADFDGDSEDIAANHEPDFEKMTEVIGKMKPTPLQSLPVEQIAAVVYAGLAPECESCGRKKVDIQPITSGDGYESVDGWVCEQCAQDNDDEYATCVFCGDDVLYRAEHINAQGECPDHDGESVMDEEEEQGWEDYIENLNKDN